MHRIIFLWAALFGILAVVTGAFGTHTLKAQLSDDDLTAFKTGVEYHFYHTIAMFIAGLLYKHYHDTLFSLAAICFATGIIFFSGSLYALEISKISAPEPIRWLGAITPFGGIAFIAGWVLIGVYFLKNPKK
jgi:uncharacterized membrane protein YgdD (TMEM256/DUF423 family)